jgi:hypothetical protein
MNTKEYMTIVNTLVDDVLAEKPETLDDAMELLHHFVDGTSLSFITTKLGSSSNT